MENELVEIQTKGMVVARDPQEVLAEAKKAAQALMTVVSQKKNPVIINKEQYLEFEDWQTVARFYGVTAKVVKTSLIDLGGVKGYEATAEVIRNNDGMVISSADSMCLNDEEKWSTRAKYEYVNGSKEKVGDIPVPLFQLRSMAQTRACAKALRNVLAWVVVLAGFKPTVAEEMTGDEMPDHPAPQSTKPVVEPPKPKTETPAPSGDVITEPQRKRLYAISMARGMDKDSFKEWLFFTFNVEDSKNITKSQYEAICEAAGKWTKQ